MVEESTPGHRAKPQRSGRKRAVPRLTMFVGLLLLLAGCCFPTRAIRTGTVPTAENGSGRQLKAGWEYKDRQLYVRVETDDWEGGMHDGNPPKNLPIYRTIKFTIDAPAKSNTVFDPARVTLNRGGTTMQAGCLIRGRSAKKGSVCRSDFGQPFDTLVHISERTVFRLLFPLPYSDGSILAIEGLTQHGEPVSLPLLHLNKTSYKTTNFACLAINN